MKNKKVKRMIFRGAKKYLPSSISLKHNVEDADNEHSPRKDCNTFVIDHIQ